MGDIIEALNALLFLASACFVAGLSFAVGVMFVSRVFDWRFVSVTFNNVREL